MHTLSRGQRAKLSDLALDNRIALELDLSGAGGLTIDTACFGLDAARKLVAEHYMTFFNQPRTPCGAVEQVQPTIFRLQLSRLPESVHALSFTLALDGAGSTMHQLGKCSARLTDPSGTKAVFDFDGSLFSNERAIMLCEIYRKDHVWRINLVAQGFDGGLDAVVKHFGGDVAQPIAAPAHPSGKVSLAKVEQEAPRLVSLVKQAKVSLEKAGLGEHQARVCLCLDISGSMHRLYSTGIVQAFAERILALACRFDDDGEIDVFLFGQNVHHPEAMTLANHHQYIGSIHAQYGLEGDTRYGKAMEAIRAFYFGGVPASSPDGLKRAETPVYVMFVTDGSTSDHPKTERQLKDSSREPIFWQFMGIGKGRKSKSRFLAAFEDSDFPFLEKLDDLPGRYLDNANFFAVASPDEHSDEALYDLLMDEYPQWVNAARQRGLFA